MLIINKIQKDYYYLFHLLFFIYTFIYIPIFIPEKRDGTKTSQGSVWRLDRILFLLRFFSSFIYILGLVSEEDMKRPRKYKMKQKELR